MRCEGADRPRIRPLEHENADIKAIYDDATLIFSIFKAMSRRARTLTERLVTCESNHGEKLSEPSE